MRSLDFIISILIVLLINIVIATIVGIAFIRTYCNLNENSNIYCIKN